MKQFVITPAMGKRLIARAIARHPHVIAALAEHTVVVVAGTTNGYVAEELLAAAGQADGFERTGFRRGVVTPPGTAAPQAAFPGDVVIARGTWDRGKEIFDVVNDLGAGDVILKGANAVDLARRRAAVYIGHPMGGTIGASMPAVIGRRVRLIVPVGLEKRVSEDIDTLAERLNVPGVEGPRMCPMPAAEIVTELDALRLLSGAAGTLLAGGGIHGAEGAVWIGVDGEPGEIDAAAELIESLAAEPPCTA